MNLTPVFSNGTEVETADARIFFSYRRAVAGYMFGRGYVRTEQFFSVTTSRHINKWLKDGYTDLPECETVPQAEIEALA